MIKPISPSDVVETKQKNFPSFVLESFNTVIARNYSNGYSRVKQNEVITEILNASDIDRSEIFENHYLDVEEVYRKAGWKVEYGYNENYNAFFIFSKAR